MRLIARRIYRAFPELDRYDDEHCRRFVSAARRGWVRRGLVTGIAGTIGLVGIAVAAAASALIYEVLDPQAGRSFGVDPLRTLAWMVASIPLLAIGPVGAYLVRDRLLRRRIAWVIRTRGRCAHCRYNLLGLPVSPDHKVACPECGMESTVDPSLGELVFDGQGRARYQPDESTNRLGPRWWTPRRRRVLVRTAAGAVALLILSVAAWEWHLRAQAALAAKQRPGSAGLLQHVLDAQPADADPNEPNAYDLFRAVWTRQQSINAAFQAKNTFDSDGARIWPDLTLIYNDPPVPGAAGAENFPKSLEPSMQLYEDLQASDMRDNLRLLSSCRVAVRPITIAPGQPMFNILLPDLGAARNIARFNGARMHLSSERGDVVEFGDAVEANIAVSRLLNRQPLLIDRLVGVAIDALTLSQIRRMLRTHRDLAWLDAVDAALRRRDDRLPFSHAIEGERLAALDTIGWFFSDPDRTRMGRWSPSLAGLLVSGDLPPGRLGSYRANREELNRHMTRFTELSEVEPWERPASGLPSETGLVLLEILLPAAESSLRSEDQVELHSRGVRIMHAIERFQMQSGRYPDSLSELAPAQPQGLPTDPWSGRAFCYRRIDPATDPQSRDYLLYSVGFDGRDDGGKRPTGGRVMQHSLSGSDPGTDFIINDSDW